MKSSGFLKECFLILKKYNRNIIKGLRSEVESARTVPRSLGVRGRNLDNCGIIIP